MTRQAGSLQIEQDLEFQRREWRVQRVAWVIVLLILIVGLLGLFGGGPLSYGEAVAGPLTIEFDRFVRKRAPTELALRIEPAAAADGEVAVWLDRAYLDQVEIERVIPEPTAMEAAGDRVVFRFTVSGAAPAAVSFALQPDEPGMTRGRIGLVDGAELAFDQFVYP